jgi:UDP-glucose 4-epimerase
MAMINLPELMSPYSGKTVVVTGAGGFIGYHLVRALLDLDANVVAVDVQRGRLSNLLPNARFTFMQRDLCDPASVAEIFAGLDPHIVFHLASLPDAEESFQHAMRSIEITLKPTISLLEAFSHSPNREIFVFGDSSKVYGNCGQPYTMGLPDAPNSSYAVTKAAAWHFCELYARCFGVPSVSIRPTMIYGPLQPRNVISYVIESVLAGREEIKLQGGDQTRSPLYVDDAVTSYLMAGQRGEAVSEKVINIAGPQEYSVVELAREIVSILGAETPVIPCMTTKRPTEIERSTCDNQEAAQWLGWSPRVTLREGVQEIVQLTAGPMQHTA